MKITRKMDKIKKNMGIETKRNGIVQERSLEKRAKEGCARIPDFS